MAIDILSISSLAVACSVWILLQVAKILRNAYWTPLRGIPGPWHAKFTHLALKKHVVTGRRMHYVHALHQRYGPVVRLSPSEIDIAEPAALNEIHRIGSGYLKDPWYQSFRQGDCQDVFSLIDPHVHAQRRKLFAPVFSNSALVNNWYTVVVEKVRITVDKMKREAVMNSGQVDVFKWWTFMTADVISLFSFGEALGMLEQEKKIEDAAKFGSFNSELPLLALLMKWIPLASVQNFVTSGIQVQKLAEETLQRVRDNGLGVTNGFSRLMAQNEKDVGAFSDFEAAFEASGFIVAGSGTTAVTLTYLVWAVMSNPAVQRRLEVEVGALDENFMDADLKGLPYLAAVIEEALRLYGAAPGALPRSVPKGGATLAGFFVPEGTTVSTQAYTLHRDPNLFAEPERFMPERFISPEGHFQPPVKGSFMPFGGGTRTCLGIHLARIELAHGAAFFFREFAGAQLAPQTTPSSMEMVNFFLVSPKAEQCWVSLGRN
ncbi:cytochrome P450 [Xylariaceae sp. FL0804]|nr:cytochrome P450 [Xylariaceae sp. FL0804]